ASLASQQRSASPTAHPTSPVDTNTLPPPPAAPSPRPESRRVRAAILDLVQRSGSESSLASTASRKDFDTRSPSDKGESTSARRVSRPADGAAASAPFSVPRVVTPEFAATPSAHAGVPATPRRSARDENAAIAP